MEDEIFIKLNYEEIIKLNYEEIEEIYYCLKWDGENKELFKRIEKIYDRMHKQKENEKKKLR